MTNTARQPEPQRQFAGPQDGRASDPLPQTLHGLVEAQVARNPDAIAARCGDSQLTYAQLNARANRIAHWLIAQGAKPGARVAFLLQRSCDWVATMLGVLKTGAAYVPLDPEYPAERLRLILDDCAPLALIASEALLPRLPALPARVLRLPTDDAALAALSDLNPGVAVTGDDVIYVIYTSGSTGRPKGCINFHRGVVNTNRWFADTFSMGAHTRFSVITSVGFDMTQKAVFGPLISGSRAVLFEPAHFDAALILDLFEREAVTGICCTPSGLYALLDDADERVYRQLESIRELSITGEALNAKRLAHWTRRPGFSAHFINACGPTECSDIITWHELGEDDWERDGNTPIGKPLPNMRAYVLDEQQRPVAPGAKGELCVSGVGVGGGYLNLPDKTAAVFKPDPFTPGAMLYRSGDLVSQRPDGVIEYHGRLDHMVKIRGFRVELPEVEVALRRAPGVREVVTGAPTGADGSTYLAAWVQMQSGVSPDLEALRAHCAVSLPEYMVPSAWVFLDKYPLNASGKVDRKALPPARRARPQLAQIFLPPTTPLQEKLAVLWRELLGFGDIGVNDPFFDLGGTSLQAIRFVGRVNQALDARIPIARFFATPSVAGFARYLEQQQGAALQRVWQIAPSHTLSAKRASARKGAGVAANQPIAIVGMAGRFPGAADLDAFWQMLCEGREGIRRVSAEELRAAGVPESLIADPSYVPAAGWLDGAESFDAEFFGYSPREAQLMDPQQRVLLETAWAALEHAGCDPQRPDARVGVYASVARSQYFARNLASHAQHRSTQLDLVFIGQDKDFAATRIAYKLDLRGPALTAQTACSSSGIALHLACQALRAGDCDAALVGASSVPVPFQSGYTHIEGGPLSKDGKVRAFDASASGMVLTAGAACVLLKPLDHALADADTIYAVIKGSALNNDGADKAAFTAPSVAGQVQVIDAALANAAVKADQISYVEAHGTGTPLGDPIEVTALTESFRRDTQAVGSCALGSVKSNIGHLDAAAAAAGLIKTALALHHRQLPPTLHFERPNPELGLESSPFFVNAALKPWKGEFPLRAGLSSFGFGGTNFHAVLEEAAPAESTPPKRSLQLLRLSAKTDAALKQQAANLAARLERSTAAELADAAYTLDSGRARLPRRGIAVARTGAGAKTALEKLITGAPAGAAPSLVLMFPGQGAQHPFMGHSLYESEPVYRREFDACADIVKAALGTDLRTLLFGGGEQAAEQLRATQLAQPAIFSVSYATARLWMSWGLEPAALIGHSVGEFVAATLAGVFELEHALKIICERAGLMQSMAGGGMMAVRLAETELQPYLKDGVDLAGLNAPQLSVVAGPRERLEALAAELQQKGVGTTALHTSHAFHSAMMEPAVEPFARAIAKYPRHAPQIPIMSTVTGGWATAEQLQDPQHWARQVRLPVRFAPALAELLQTPGRVFLECGPGQNLTTSSRQTIKPNQHALAIASLPHPGAEGADAAAHLLEAAGRLWLGGIELDPVLFYEGEQRHKIGLPTYPFAKTRHWIEPAAESVSGQTAADGLGDGSATSDRPAAAPTAPGAQSDQDSLTAALVKSMQTLTGLDFAPEDRGKSFLDLGLDSLMLTQVAGRLKNEFKVDLRFRQLLEELPNFDALADWLKANAKGAPGVTATAARATVAATAPETQPAANEPPKKAFGAGLKIVKTLGAGLSARQQECLDQISKRYLAKTGKSKAYAQKYRAQLADPRTVSGFRPLIKELIYPIVTDRSEGAYIWDLDGNRYIDTLNGYGCVFFGHKPKFVADAVAAQLQRGWEIGPQTPLAGECAQLFCEMTGNERVAFCNTGSEAVLAAIRMSRMVTGRNLIVMFSGDYHGINDEVIVRPGSNLRSVPAAPGIPPEAVANTLILDYGLPKSLEILRARADEVAAVIVEPVQSRRPDWQPREFLHEVRRITEASGSAMVMDEVITGFRTAPGGAQEYFGVQADIGTYGKVFGGGMPIGAVAGKARFLDALDGGGWRYGDDSVPEAGVTYFAGTFVRHPLTMAAVKACIEYLRDHPGSQARVNRRTEQMVDRLNTDFQKAGVPMHIARFGSLWKPEYLTEQTHGDIFYYFMREAGIHIWDGRPCFLTLGHSDEDCERIIEAFRYAVAETQRGDFFEGSHQKHEVFFNSWRSPYLPPATGAKPGLDIDGNPAWFAPDPERPGKYMQVELK